MSTHGVEKPSLDLLQTKCVYFPLLTPSLLESSMFDYYMLNFPLLFLHPPLCSIFTTVYYEAIVNWCSL
jgi:hypothetical protein